MEEDIKSKPDNIIIEAEYILLNGKKSALVNSQSKFEVKLKNDYLDFDITKDFFIRKIYCSIENVDFDRFTLKYKLINSKEYTVAKCIKEESDENKVTFSIGAIIHKFQIYYNKGVLDWTKPFLHGISVDGLPLEILEPYYNRFIDLENSMKEMKEINDKAVNSLKSKEEIFLKTKQEFESQKPQLEAKITELNSLLNNINTSIAEKEKEKNKTIALYESEKTKLEELNSKLTILQGSLSQLSSDISNKTNEKNNLSLEVTDVQSKLRDLKKTFATYANEYSSFNKQSNLYIGFYSLLLFIPVFILGFVLYELFKGTVDLTTLYKKEENLDIKIVFLSRLPFVSIAGFLIYGSFQIFKLISLKIMDIQAEKLSFSKISIVAQDIVNLSTEGLTLTDEQIQDTNIYLRIEMLKAYMKETIGKDFEYKVRDQAIFDSVKDQIILKLLPQKWKDLLNSILKVKE